MTKYVIALVLLATLAIAVPRMVPYARGNSELNECLGIKEPIDLDSLVARFENGATQVSEIGAGKLLSITPSQDYLRVTSTPILALVPDGGMEVLWLRCAEGSYAFGEDRI